MTLQHGSDVILKIGDGAETETFATLGGLRILNMQFSSAPAIHSGPGTDGWQVVADGIGSRSLTISGEGWLTESSSETNLRSVAFNNTLRNMQIVFANDDVLSGPFRITRYERQATQEDPVRYQLTLTSAGAITYTAA
ncbi:MAG: hypothetical protein H6908_06790 [Hyphomicrobiales bacterium]|nr:hypothetical protein [Rickettsiales bacterium]MCP5362318.1 hypothetical protein [Hyphomicrobiales bacterium]